jgi:hypothetical protein
MDGGHPRAAGPGDWLSTLSEVSDQRLIAASQMIRRSPPGSPKPFPQLPCADRVSLDQAREGSSAHTGPGRTIRGWSTSQACAVM